MTGSRVTPAINSINELALSISKVGIELEVEFMNRVVFTLSWANGSSLNATVTFEYSHDKVRWFKLPLDTDPTLTGASGSHYVEIGDTSYKYLRPLVIFTAGSGDILIIAKGTNN